MKTEKGFEIRHEKSDDVHIMHVYGHFDSISSESAQKIILEALEKADKIVFNLGGLLYISSAGLRVILYAAKKGKRRNVRMVFCSPEENIRKIFEISNFHTILDIVDDMDSALGKLKS